MIVVAQGVSEIVILLCNILIEDMCISCQLLQVDREVLVRGYQGYKHYTV